MTPFINEQERPVNVFCIKATGLGEARTKAAEFFKGHPGIEVLQINNGCMTFSAKMVDCVWIYYRKAVTPVKDNKRI